MEIPVLNLSNGTTLFVDWVWSKERPQGWPADVLCNCCARVPPIKTDATGRHLGFKMHRQPSTSERAACCLTASPIASLHRSFCMPRQSAKAATSQPATAPSPKSKDLPFPTSDSVKALQPPLPSSEPQKAVLPAEETPPAATCVYPFELQDEALRQLWLQWQPGQPWTAAYLTPHR